MRDRLAYLKSVRDFLSDVSLQFSPGLRGMFSTSQKIWLSRFAGGWVGRPKQLLKLRNLRRITGSCREFEECW